MKNWLVLLLAVISFTSNAQRIGFNSDWKFIQQDVQGAEETNFNDASWRTLDLPHDWSIEEEYNEENPMGDQCGYLPAGFGWYRKTIPIPKEWKDKYVEIAFDGVFMNSTVWANGQKLGHRPYGWISFAYDISDVIQNSESVTFSVRVDNDKQPSARWYTGSGIYANTWLIVKDKVHVIRDGVFICTKGSSLAIDTEVANTTTKLKKIKIKTSILDAAGKIIQSTESPVSLYAGKEKAVAQSLTLSDPKLWSVESPYLYTAKTEVYIGRKLIDCVETRFGVRDIEWISETGMWLNGKNVKLQGVCNHQDAGALGAAVPDKILRFRLEQLKKMGVNAIRTSHNPQTPVFYNMCDEMGILVMDEIFDGWMQKARNDYGAHSFDEWWEKDLSDWIKRDRNHPSIIIYSVGNETHGDIARNLVEKCHKMDDTRPVTSGHSGSEFMDVLGVNGSSEKLGWFETLEKDRVFIGTENTHTWQVRGFYRTHTWYRDGYPSTKQKPYWIPDLTETEVFSNDWTDEENRINGKQIFNSSYDNAMVRLTARHNIAQIRDIPNYAGSFRWTGYDYIGEAGYVHGGWPFKSFMGGAIDMANFEKDLYYLYQSQWTSEPMVHILPHWTHPQIQKGTKIPVWVYSNCESVELFLNGRSLGKKVPGSKWDEMQCQWMLGWEPGELKAVAYIKGKAIAEEVIQTADAPSRIALSIDGEPLSRDGKDIVQVRVTTIDQKGEFYPFGENRTYFNLIGPGKIRALDNGSPIDVEKHFEATNRIAFYGLTRAYIESIGEKGDITLLASCILGEKRQITSNLVNIDVQLLSLRGPLPDVDLKTYYTIDGSSPTTESKLFTKPFSVEMGTTVRALVIMDDEEVHVMEERFAADEGFEWTVKQKTSSIPGDQAEEAKFEGAKFADSGEGFNGKGYLNFSKTKGSFVEWYLENDGSEGEAELWIRYAARNKNALGTYLNLTVNEELIDNELLFRNTKNPELDWRYVKVPIQMGRGANTVRLTTLDEKTINIDEILIR